MSLIAKDSVPVRSLVEYLSHPNRVLEVPPWQREYVWNASESGEIGVLLQDLREFFESSSDEYLMGSVILSPEGSDPEKLHIIDGQQRTLTFLIFLFAAAKYISNAGLKEVDNLAHEKLSQDMRKCMSFDLFDYVKRVSMNQQQANVALQTLFAWSKVADGELSDEFIADKEHWTETHRNIVVAAEWLYEQQFKENKWIAKADFIPALIKILTGIKFIEITLEDQLEAIAVFDRINDRGAQLNSGDLIKNRIFMSVESDEDFGKITASWTTMNDSLIQSSLTRLREPKFLLRALALGHSDGPISESQKATREEEPETKAQKITYEKLTKFWGDRLNPPKNSAKPLEKLDPLNFANLLVSSADWLQKLSKEKSPRNQDLRELYFTRYLKSVQHYPVLLAGRHLSDKAVFERLVKQVHNRTAFYLLSDERTQDFESLIPNWTSRISKLKADSTIDELDQVCLDGFSINNNQFNLLEEQFHSWSYKDPTEKKKIRAVLSQLSRMVDKHVKKEDSESPQSYFRTRKNEDGKSWDIDHIAPGGKEDKHSHLHTIGNLVLLHPNDNRSKKDAPPASKIDNYKDSRLYLTKTLATIPIESERKRIQSLFDGLDVSLTSVNLNHWNTKSIEQRANLYFALLKHHLTSNE